MQSDKIRISAVSFLNTLPFRYGLNHSEDIQNMARIEYDIPSVCASRLLSSDVDIGLVPVAALKEMSNYHIISDYCIGAQDQVDSVYLFGDVPVEKMQKIMLDYRSRTSAGLTRILASEYWKIEPEWIKAEKGYESSISGNTGGLIIGDKALEMADRFSCRYDLATEWFRHTGKEFVFAAWVSRKPLPEYFIETFNRALSNGLSHIDEALAELGRKYKHLPARHYLTKSIDFSLTESKLQSLNLYLKKLESV
ncbi:MAG TPA: menaquinone biosynthesis protein [Bacteroidales bacterium]|nr:menaquinone biosynthesis protein [Bacteroidales bacterium]